jgi:hypothetical protein
LIPLGLHTAGVVNKLNPFYKYAQNIHFFAVLRSRSIFVRLRFQLVKNFGSSSDHFPHINYGIGSGFTLIKKADPDPHIINADKNTESKRSQFSSGLTWKMSMCEEWAIEDMLGLLFFPRMNWIACNSKYL